jgi:preprotein translocase subunit SecG
MNRLSSFPRIPALLAAASSLLIGDMAQASLTTAKGTGEETTAVVWIALAAFVLGTLGLAFWNSKRREAE